MFKRLFSKRKQHSDSIVSSADIWIELDTIRYFLKGSSSIVKDNVKFEVIKDYWGEESILISLEIDNHVIQVVKLNPHALYPTREFHTRNETILHKVKKVTDEIKAYVEHEKDISRKEKERLQTAKEKYFEDKLKEEKCL